MWAPLCVGLIILCSSFPPETGTAKPLSTHASTHIPIPANKPAFIHARYITTIPTPVPKPVQSSSHRAQQKAKQITLKPKPATINRSQWQKDFIRKVETNIQRNRPTYALNLLKKQGQNKIHDRDYDRLRAMIAFSYLFEKRLQTAKELAQDSLNRSHTHVPLAGWVLGMVYWQEENFEQSASAFEMAAKSNKASAWTMSAAAYWAARAMTRQDKSNSKKIKALLTLAAQNQDTFYGLIATRALGHDIVFDWSEPTYQDSHLSSLSRYKNGEKAINMIKKGNHVAAEKILQRMKFQPQDMEAVLSIAHHFNMPALSLQTGQKIKNTQQKYHNAALYPTPTWRPQSGHRLDPALLHAIIRQESKFQPQAKNPSGATGLMQLMPATARGVTPHLKQKEKINTNLNLQDPTMNLEIGQSYIEQLLKFPSIQHDLFSLITAYNAGPGTLSKWKKQSGGINDPLLFIEMIPYPETRAFVERVMANYWIYRTKGQQNTPTLSAVANDQWPIYSNDNNQELQRIASSQ